MKQAYKSYRMMENKKMQKVVRRFRGMFIEYTLLFLL